MVLDPKDFGLERFGLSDYINKVHGATGDTGPSSKFTLLGVREHWQGQNLTQFTLKHPIAPGVVSKFNDSIIVVASIVPQIASWSVNYVWEWPDLATYTLFSVNETVMPSGGIFLLEIANYPKWTDGAETRWGGIMVTTHNTVVAPGIIPGWWPAGFNGATTYIYSAGSDNLLVDGGKISAGVITGGGGAFVGLVVRNYYFLSQK